MLSINPVKATNTKDRDKCRDHLVRRLYDDMKPTVVDLFDLRCAIAVLLRACHHIDDLTTTNLVRLDSAVRHLSGVRSQMHGDFAANTDALLSNDLDPAGRRTIDAIAQLAMLAQITESNSAGSR